MSGVSNRKFLYFKLYINNLENVPTAIGPSEKSTVTFYIDTLNGKNYIQFFENDIDRGYLFFDESRNLKS